MNAAYESRRTRVRDSGAILPIVLVVVVVLGVVVAAIATYTTTTLRYGGVVERSADRLATANAAMDNALEAIGRNASECTLTGQAAQPGGWTYHPFDMTINDIEKDAVSVHCQIEGGDFDSVGRFAVMMTGMGTGRTGPLLTAVGASSVAKPIKGPVYMADVPVIGSTAQIDAPLTISDGDLWYSHTSPCKDLDDPPEPVLEQDGPNDITIILPGVPGCTDASISEMVAGQEPAVPAAGTTRTTYVDIQDKCVIWEPGYYATAPSLSAGIPGNQKVQGTYYHYFRSGAYHFGGGTWTIGQGDPGAWVLMGNPGPEGPGVAGNHNLSGPNPCRNAWETDTGAGAVLYLGGSSRIAIGSNGNLEISGMPSGEFNVSLQALGSSTLTDGDDPIVEVTAGNDRQFSTKGLVWAPTAALDLVGVTNTAVAALRGGAVVSELRINVSGSALGFVIGVEPQETVAHLVVTASATNSGTTSIRSRLDFAESGGYELTSRRVENLTP